MKKSILAMAIATSLVMSGCSSMNPFSKTETEKQEELAVSKIEFLKSKGGIKLEFTEDGKWVKLQSTGTAETVSKNPNGAHEAYRVATLRAQRNISEFLNTDVRSKTMVDAVSTLNVGDVENLKKDNNELVYKLIENITQDSHAMVVGMYVVKRDFDEDNKMVSVTIEVTQKSVQASQQLKKVMRGAAR